MRVFITGGTGLIGSAVIAELITAGHSVTALTRSEASAAKAQAAGATNATGTLTDFDVLREQATRADGVIHLAFGNDFSSPEALADNIADETAALETLGDALLGTGKPLVVVSGTPQAEGRPSTEDDPLPAFGPVAGRSITVDKILALADRGIRTSSIRLPRTVHNNGDGGFAGLLTQIARQTGVAGYPGSGAQRWPAVHVRDAAALFRLALENAPGGTAWHAVADEGDSVKDIMTVVGRQLRLPVAEVPAGNFGPLGVIFMADQPASSARTRAESGWQPKHPSLLADLENIQA